MPTEALRSGFVRRREALGIGDVGAECGYLGSAACGRCLRARLVEVVGIDDERLGQLARRAGEPAENEDAALVFARGDELLGDEIHPVLQGRDETQVGRSIDRGQQLGVDVLVHEHDGLPVSGAIPLVDVPDGIEEVGFEILVRRELGARWRRDDDHRESIAQLGGVMPQPVERPQPLGDAFRVVDAVDADA